MEKNPQRPRENRAKPLPSFSPSIPSKRTRSDDIPFPIPKRGFSSTNVTHTDALQSLPISNFVVGSLPLSAQHQGSVVQGLRLDIDKTGFKLHGDVSKIFAHVPLAIPHITSLSVLGIDFIDDLPSVAPGALPCRDAALPSCNNAHQQQFSENTPSAPADRICYSPSSPNPTNPAFSIQDATRRTPKTKDEHKPVRKFFCSFPDCEEKFTKAEWKKHEEEKHERNFEYKCKSEDCQSQFDCPRKFNRHLQKISKCREKSDCAAKCRNFIGSKKAWGCGFCAGTFYEWNERVAHVEKHQEQGKQKMAWSHSRVILGLLNQRAMRDHWPYLKKENFDHDYPGYLWDLIDTKELQEDLEYGGRGDKAKLVTEAWTLLTKDSLNPARDLNLLSTPLSLSTPTAAMTDPRQHNITNTSGLPTSSVATSSTMIQEAPIVPNTGDEPASHVQAEFTPPMSYHANLRRRVVTTPLPITNNNETFNFSRAESFPRMSDWNTPSLYAAPIPSASTCHNAFPWLLSETTYQPQFNDSQMTPIEHGYDNPNNIMRHMSSGAF